MATIKAIEARSVHQIQSGQVIVDLCSVVKELVENSLDAGATSIDIRFKNNGLEAIEVQDNGAGISSDDYETIALKHYTSKLSTYDDLMSLGTFGFRGEALSSLCALSKFHILTARDGEAPKGTRLDFDISGKLGSATVAACQKGTTVALENLFYNLPVRRRELEKNIRREYNKVLGILHAYACISAGVRFGVSNQATKGKKVVVFSTRPNATVSENIANIYGTKTILALIPLQLELELQFTAPSQLIKDIHVAPHGESRKIRIIGYISRPVFGEGRQTPDRQMFFVNSRPCGLPQAAKAFNEVYRSYNVTQSPFIFADFKLDTNSYDVNVSPDKRTILLHDQTALLDRLKDSLVQLFEAQEQTIPQAQLAATKLPSYSSLTVSREASAMSKGSATPEVADAATEMDRGQSSATSTIVGPNTEQSAESRSENIIQMFFEDGLEDRQECDKYDRHHAHNVGQPSKDKQRLAKKIEKLRHQSSATASLNDQDFVEGMEASTVEPYEVPRRVQDFNDRLASQQAKSAQEKQENFAPAEQEIHSVIATPHRAAQGLVESVFARMRPMRTPGEIATITVGSKTSTTIIGTPTTKRRKLNVSKSQSSFGKLQPAQFADGLQAFAAPGTLIVTSYNEATCATDSTLESESQETVLTRQQSRLAAEGGLSPDGPFSASDVDDEEREGVEDRLRSQQDEDSSDEDYYDESEMKTREEARIQEIIQRAEETAAIPTQQNQKRVASFLKRSPKKDSTVNLVRLLDTSVARIEEQLSRLSSQMVQFAQLENNRSSTKLDEVDSNEKSPEERLSLTISKTDFVNMRIIGQFNLGFILATRSADHSDTACSTSSTHTQNLFEPKSSDDLFIIDQHASDEIYNFSRLSATTSLTPQPLVHPHPLPLTAIEEETILTHTATLSKNGFTISIDTSGTSPVGQRCKLLTLPTSRETVFTIRDLEELLALLSEAPPPAEDVASDDDDSWQHARPVIRPSKVRKMLAMRACRSSIMVGKTLSRKGMEGVVRHMGEIERPWNCPHGRPTMRHLARLGEWVGWCEGDGLREDGMRRAVDWGLYARGGEGILEKDNDGMEMENVGMETEDDGNEGENDDGDITGNGRGGEEGGGGEDIGNERSEVMYDDHENIEGTGVGEEENEEGT